MVSGMPGPLSETRISAPISPEGDLNRFVETITVGIKTPSGVLKSPSGDLGAEGE